MKKELELSEQWDKRLNIWWIIANLSPNCWRFKRNMFWILRSMKQIILKCKFLRLKSDTPRIWPTFFHFFKLHNFSIDISTWIHSLTWKEKYSMRKFTKTIKRNIFAFEKKIRPFPWSILISSSAVQIFLACSAYNERRKK